MFNEIAKHNLPDFFSHLVRSRHAVRDYEARAVPAEIIERVLSDAQQSPSNANTQPWNVHVVSGDRLQRLSMALMTAVSARNFSSDFSYSAQDYTGIYAERSSEQAKIHADGAGVSRDDADGRMRLALRNYAFFGAPHAAFLFTPQVGDGVRSAADVGMYGQTLLLSLAANGLAGVPQTSVALLADTVRQELGISSELKLLFSISFGYAAGDSTAKQPMPRAPLTESVTFHE